MIKSAIALSLAVSVLTAAVPAIGADQLQCLSPSKLNDPAKLEQTLRLLPDVNATMDIEKLNAAIASFRREGVQKKLIVDHFVGAYCSVVARETLLTEAEKIGLVQQFTGQVTRLVYSLESGLDVIINVPLTPDIVDAVNTVARRQGLSGPAWIAMIIDNALQQNTAQRQ